MRTRREGKVVDTELAHLARLPHADLQISDQARQIVLGLVIELLAQDKGGRALLTNVDRDTATGAAICNGRVLEKILRVRVQGRKQLAWSCGPRDG